MTWTNIFRNSYVARENRLTYNFLCTVELMGALQEDFIKFLLSERNIKLDAKPLLRIRPVYSFESGSNPDGCIMLRRANGKVFSVFLEVKTNRRQLEKDQLSAHLKYHAKSNVNSMLLVITPREGDGKIVEEMKDTRLRFISWQRIADYLIRQIQDKSGTIVEHFLDCCSEEGEFMSTELDKQDIELLISYMVRQPEIKLKGAFERLTAEFDFAKYLKLLEPPYWQDAWGRKGIEIQLAKKRDTKWISYSIYYNAYDHAIPFKLDTPELALFIDIEPSGRYALSQVPDFISILSNLEKIGWEENLKNRKTINDWRLIWWRKPLCELERLDTGKLSQILEERLQELHSHKFFPNYYKVRLT